MEQNMVMLSVIIPMYNAEKYIVECLENVIVQSSGDLEIIVVDDGSTDDSGSICMRYATEYQNIKYLKQKNAKQGAARNTGLLQARGKYIVFLDSDDYWKHDFLIKTKECLIKYPYLDILYFDSDVYYENDKIPRNDIYDLKVYNRKGRIKECVYKGKEYFNVTYPLYFNVSPCMAVFRKEFILKRRIMFPENVFYEDNLFSLQTVLEAEFVKYIPQKLYVRRYRMNSTMTSDIDQERIKSSAEIFLLIMDYVEKEQKKFQKAVFRKVMDFSLSIACAFWLKCSEHEKSVDVRLKEGVCKKVYDFIRNKDKNNLYLEEWNVLILLSEFLKKNTEMRYFIKYILEKEDMHSLKEFLFDCKKNYCMQAETKLRNLFGSLINKKVGLYGNGNHTKELLRTIDLIGVIGTEIIIIDSKIESGTQELEGLPVLNVRDVPRDTEVVVISSFLYEQEMYEIAVKYLPNHIRIKRIYQDEMREICWEWLRDVR